MMEHLLTIVEFVVLVGVCVFVWFALTMIGWRPDITAIIAGTALYRSVQLGRKNEQR